jgi:hypothetical protein
MPSLRMISAAGVPSSCCFMAATICSVENRFRFMAYALLKGSIMPETNLQNGSGIAGPLIYIREIGSVGRSWSDPDPLGI